MSITIPDVGAGRDLWRDRSGRTATTLLAGATAMLLLLIALGVSLSFARASSETSRVRSSLIADAERHAALLDQRLLAQLRVLVVIVQTPVIRAGDADGIETYLRRLGEEPVGFEGGVGFVSADPSAPIVSPSPIADEAQARAVALDAMAAQAGQGLRAGGLSTDVGGERPLLALAVRVSVDGQTTGAVVGLKDPLTLDPTGLGDPAALRYLVTAEGQTVAMRDGQPRIVSADVDDLSAALAERGAGSEDLDARGAEGVAVEVPIAGVQAEGPGLDGVPRLRAAAPMTTCDCIAVVEADPGAVLAPISRRRAIEVTALLLVAAIGMLLLLRVIRQLRGSSATEAVARDTAEALQTGLSVMAGASRIDGVYDAVNRHFVEALGAVAGGLIALDPDGADDPLATMTVNALRPIAERTVTQGPVMVSLDVLRRRAPEAADAVAAVGGAIVVAAPVAVVGQMTGALLMVLPRGYPLRRWTLDRLSVLGAQVANALGRTARSEFEREVARTLRASLLDADSPSIDDIEVATRYVPATLELDVGGDWYQSVRAADGSLMVIIGDVVGHGLQAAAAMGQVRSAAKALGRYHGPAELLEHLDDFVADTPACYMCSAAAVRIDPSGDVLTYAIAGHPPPVLRCPDGGLVMLDGVTGPPLGVDLGARRRSDSTPFAPGAALLLYTDGLVERRGVPMDIGLDRVRGVLAGQSHETAGAVWLDQVLDGAHPDEADDDIAMLLVRRALAVPTPMAHDLSRGALGQTVSIGVQPSLPPTS